MPTYPREPSNVTAGAIGENGFYYAPTVVAGAHQEDEIVRREVFGPVVSVTRFSLKQSGYGKDLSVYALEDYTAARHIMVAHA